MKIVPPRPCNQIDIGIAIAPICFVVESCLDLELLYRIGVGDGNPPERDLLFATRNGTPWDANLLVKRKLYPLLDSLGIERGGLHAFRHTNSTLMDRLRVPLKVRQERLGHSDSSLTLDVYTHVASEDDVRFAAQLDGILRPNAPKKEKPESAGGTNSGFIN